MATCFDFVELMSTLEDWWSAQVDSMFSDQQPNIISDVAQI